MKIVFWYVIVVIDVSLLIMSFIYNNIFLTILSFIIALVLNKFKNIIPIPKLFQNLNIISNKNKKSNKKNIGG
ncbi:hypothetical protein [Clostridium sp.]|uniref:hypothetical protein n=1 Tax=Clostridium sp. TaxID=1506 RepID=UPI003D6D2444